MRNDSNTSLRQQRTRSLVWQSFKKADRFKAQCLSCPQVLQIKFSNTSPLSRRLKTKYSDVTNICKRTNTEREIDNCGRNKIHLNKNSAKTKQLTNAIPHMMALDLQTFSIVEDIAFWFLLNVAEPRYDIPSRSTFAKSIIPNMYEDLRNNIIGKIQSDIAEGN